MAVTISNVGSLQAQTGILSNQRETQSALTKLSSGKRVNSAQDDAAALAIAVSLTAQQTSVNQAIRNAGDAVDLSTIADLVLHNTTDILARIRELSIAAGSGALDPTARGDVQNEIVALQAEIDRLASSSEFNGTPLLNGRAAHTYQVGSGNDPANDRLTVTTADATSAALGLGQVSVADQASAASSLDAIDAAQSAALSAQTTLGAQARRAALAELLDRESSISLARARGQLIDANVATESSDLSRSLILGNATASVLVQANQQPESALRLLAV